MHDSLINAVKTSNRFDASQEFRMTGIDFISEVSWGTHLSLFYESTSDLINILAPYFKAGLENNEFCMWITSSLSVNEAVEAMNRIMPQFNHYLQQGQIEIKPYTDWYLNEEGQFQQSNVLDSWIFKTNSALSKGYEGMRLSGDTFWLEKTDWTSFNDYECQVHSVLRKHRMIAICTYHLDKCNSSEIIDICKYHHLAIIKQKDVQQDLIFNKDVLTSRGNNLNSLVIMDMQNMTDVLLRLDRLNLVGEMAASMGHEIRNPLTTIRGNLQLLNLNNNDAETQERLTLMIDELDRANSIITDYLDLVKHKTKDMNLLPSSLNKIIEDIFPLIQAEAFMSNHYLELSLDEDISDLLLDQKEIRQLILNLVRNGLEAMDENKKLIIRTIADNDHMVLSIQDEGKGIDPALIEKIYRPFYTTKENGTGLGLAICSSIASKHNAKLDIESDSNGTTVLVRFQRSKG